MDDDDDDIGYGYDDDDDDGDDIGYGYDDDDDDDDDIGYGYDDYDDDIGYGYDDIVDDLIYGYDDDNTKTPILLQRAVENGKDGLALSLIQAGANTNIVDETGQTLLMKAVHFGVKQTALELISRGVDLNITDTKGNSALMYAVKYEELVSAIISKEKAMVNARNREGRTPLFYAMLQSNNSANILLNNGANLHITDDCNLSPLSFFIYNGINKMSDIQSDIHAIQLKFSQTKGIEDQTILRAIINAVFCKLPHDLSSASVRMLPFLEIASHFYKDVNGDGKKTIESITTTMKEGKLTINNLPDVLISLFELGADPNTVDETGNTACHYLSQSLLNLSELKEISDIWSRLKKLGLSVNKKNLNKETPLMFSLSNVAKRTQNGQVPGIKQMLEISRFLLEDHKCLEAASENGKSVFHLIIEIIQKGLNLQDEAHQKHILDDAVQLFDLLCTASIKHKVTVNKVDDQINSPLHCWATLSLPSPQQYHSEISRETFQDVLARTFNHLLRCGVLLNVRNHKEETPLHLCKTWSAVTLLVDAGANLKDVDLAGGQPLLAAAHNQLFLEKAGFFYPDVTEDSPTFWRNAVKKGFDICSCDKDGNSVISNLIKGEAFVLAKAFVEVVCDKTYSSKKALDGILNAICKDESIRTTWKALLVDMILKSRNKPKDLNSCLRLCCTNVASKKVYTLPMNIALDEISNQERQTSIHWEIARKLLAFGANGEYCMDLVNDCPSLKDLLTNKLSIDEVPMVIPWTSNSKTHENSLAEVARGRNYKPVGSYWYHCNQIASGRFGRVYVGINEKDGMEVAIKRIEKEHMARPEDIREIRTFSAVNCKQIVQYLSFTENEDFSFIAMELMEGNVDDYFRSTHYVCDCVRNTSMCKDIAMGLSYLHDQNIIHRDLKPSNILYKINPMLCLKIADFGLSRPMDMTLSETVLVTNAGTRGWIAPEVARSTGKVHSKLSDIFSCGLIIHYIFSDQRHPFNPSICTDKSVWQITNETEHNILNNNTEGLNESLPSEVSHILMKMLDSNEKERPGASELLDHPMFWSDKKKMDFLCAVGDQEEFECPRANRTSETGVEKELKASFHTVVNLGRWDDARYEDMNDIITETTKPVVKYDKKGKLYKSKVRKKYDKESVVELVRFIRNSIAHATDPTIKKLIHQDAIFLKYFPGLVIEVYKAIMKHKWNGRHKIQCAMKN